MMRLHGAFLHGAFLHGEPAPRARVVDWGRKGLRRANAHSPLFPPPPLLPPLCSVTRFAPAALGAALEVAPPPRPLGTKPSNPVRGPARGLSVAP